MAGRHGHKSATAVQDVLAGARHRTPHGPSTTAADRVPEPRGTAVPTAPPPDPERRRRWPWAVLGLLVLAAIGTTLFGGGADTAPTAETVPAPALAPAPGLAPAPAPPSAIAPPTAPPGSVTLPRIGGRNAASALAELRRLGLTEVRLVTDDDRTVDDPGKWTAVGLQPEPGTAVAPDRTIVVTVSQDP